MRMKYVHVLTFVVSGFLTGLVISANSQQPQPNASVQRNQTVDSDWEAADFIRRLQKSMTEGRKLRKDQDDIIYTTTLKLTMLSRQDRIAAIKKLPHGVYVNLPEYWQNVLDPMELRKAIRYFREPVSPDMLRAIIRLLPKVQNQYSRTDMGAILYRYSVPVGKLILVHAVNTQNDQGAATILALNRETPQLKSILKAFAVHTPINADLVGALAQWPNHNIARALWAKFQMNKDDRFLIAALALQNYQPARATFYHIYVSNRLNNPQLSDIAACALFKLGDHRGAVSIAKFKHWIEAYPDSQTDEERFNVFPAIRLLCLSPVTPSLNTLINKFVKLTDEQTKGHLQETEQAVQAAECLSEISKNPEVLRTTIALLKRLNTRPTITPYKWRTACLVDTLSSVLHRDNALLLDSTMGTAWVDRQDRLSKLRRVPRFMMPD